MTDISVVIPVGPDPKYKEYLKECIKSVIEDQTVPVEEIIIVDDSQGALLSDRPSLCWGKGRKEFTELFGLPEDVACEHSYIREHGTLTWDVDSFPLISYYAAPWNVGVADAFNFGIALSRTNLVFTIGSDDKMLPTCLEECVKAYEEHQIEGWYNVTHITESGVIGAIPNNSAMVTKKLWEYTGGFPPSAGVAACDALLLSILMKHAPERIIQVKEGEPLIWLREGAYQDTCKNMMYYAQSGVVEQIRNMETLRWAPKN